MGLLAHRCGHHAAKEIIVIGDGATWIWYMLQRCLFPGAIQILRLLCMHVSNIAQGSRSLHVRQQGTDAGKKWQKERQLELRDNGANTCSPLPLQRGRPTRMDDQDVQRTQCLSTFTENAKRMLYKTYIEKGYHIGSGVVEATAKHVVVQRLDQAGMHWRPDTADAIVALRSNKRSTNPTSLQPYLAMAA